MARLVGFISNRPDLGARAAELYASQLAVRARGASPPGFGVGFYQNGEVLLKRRPIFDRSEISPADMLKDVRADLLIAHVRLGHADAARTENTNPFRYRQWLFAHTGTLEDHPRLGARMAESIPGFLKRDLRGETGSEIFFHLFLSFLHDAGKLDRPAVDAQSVRSALRACMALSDRLCAEEGLEKCASNILVANPESLLAVQGAAPMGFRFFSRLKDFERLFSPADFGKYRLSDFANAKLCLVASDFEDGRLPPDWIPVQGRAIVTFDRTHEPQIEPL